MIDKEYREKYPIGTKVKFINPNLDTGKIGKIVGYLNDRPTVYLPRAYKHVMQNYHPTLPGNIKFTWHCSWREIEILSQKGQQLVFDFMY